MAALGGPGEPGLEDFAVGRVQIGKHQLLRPGLGNKRGHVADTGTHLAHSPAQVGRDPTELPAIVAGGRLHDGEGLGPRLVSGLDCGGQGTFEAASTPCDQGAR